MAGILGADLVGMSTVPEVILARLPRPARWRRFSAGDQPREPGSTGGAPHHAGNQGGGGPGRGRDLGRFVEAFLAGLPEPGGPR